MLRWPGWGRIGALAPPHAARAFAAACVAALPSVAGASELSWQGPAACSERDQLSFQIEQALGTPLAKLADLQFLVQLERAEAPFVARLRVTRPGSGAASERVLTGTDCAKLVDTLTVAVALALGAYDRVDEMPAGSEPLPVSPALPVPSNSAPEVDAAAPAEESRQADRLSAGALALLVSDFGSLPEPALGAAVGLELGWRALRLQLTGTMFFDQHLELAPPSGPPAGADLNLVVGGVLGCTNVLETAASPFVVPLCAGGELGRLAGVGQGVPDAHEGAVFWGALLLEAGAFWHVPHTALRLGALLTAVAPLNRDEFVLRGIGSVHRPSSLVGRGSVGLGVDFE